MVAGDAAVLAAEPVTVPVPLPSRGWTLAAAPPDGWSPPPGLWRDRVLFALAALLLALPILGTGPLLRLRRRQRALIGAREAELSRLSWRLEFALAASKIGVWDVDLETDRLIWDDRAKALFGFAATRPTASSARPTGRRRCIPRIAARALAEADEAVADGGRFVAEYRIVRPDGEVRHIRDMAAVYVATDGARRLVGLVWDVTADVERQRGAEPAADRGGGGDGGEVALPRGDEPRDPDADGRRARAAGADARRAAADASSASGRRSRSPRRRACSRS